MTAVHVQLVCFDALYTLVRPRLPIHVQYAHAFAPFFGHLPPDKVKPAFNAALAELRTERPAYAQGAQDWWRAVVARTAVGAGADPKAVDDALPVLVPALLQRFSSKKGYALYPDVIPTLQALRHMHLKTALVSNADSRILAAIDDLGALTYFDHVLVSDLEGIEKPHPQIFLRACSQAHVQPHNAIHVGDELATDYFAARRAGLASLLLSRVSDQDAQTPTHKVTRSDPQGVHTIPDLYALLDHVRSTNAPDKE